MAMERAAARALGQAIPAELGRLADTSRDAATARRAGWYCGAGGPNSNGWWTE